MSVAVLARGLVQVQLQISVVLWDRVQFQFLFHRTFPQYIYIYTAGTSRFRSLIDGLQTREALVFTLLAIYCLVRS